MAWLKIDDAMGEHRKTRRLMKRHGLAPFGLHALALLHCSRYLTDGRVDAEFVDEALDDAKVKPRDRDTIVGALVESGQWDIDPNGGWIIHDYLDHNPSRAQVEAQREKDRLRKAAGGRNRKPGKGPESPDASEGVWMDSARNPSGVQAASESPVPSRPVPSNNNPPSPPRGERPGNAPVLGDTPPPSVPSSGRKRDQDEYDRLLATWSGMAVPEASEHYRLAGARHALSVIEGQRKQPTLRGVRWLAGHGQVNAFGLDDEQRAAIRREFITAHNSAEAAA